MIDAAGKIVGTVSGMTITLADGTTTVSFTSENITTGAIIRVSDNGNTFTMERQ